jgi:hypothetical protein
VYEDLPRVIDAVVVPMSVPLKSSLPLLVAHVMFEPTAEGLPQTMLRTTMSEVILELENDCGRVEIAPMFMVRILFSNAALAVLSLMLYVTPLAVI